MLAHWYTLLLLDESGDPVWPDPADVRDGVVYGPTGSEYLGVLVGGGGLTGTQAAQLLALVRIHGLVVGEPLTVTPTLRTAGPIAQTIGEAGGVVTVERTA